MADDLTTTTTVATIPNATKVMSFETTSHGHKQVVTTSSFTRPSANFTRPADTTAYAIGDLVANSTTAASVVPLSWTSAIAHTTTANQNFAIRRAKIKKSGTTATNGIFRLHIYGTDPSATTGIANGDNGAYSVNDAAYLGWFDFATVIAHRNMCVSVAAPAAGVEITHTGVTTVYGLLEARAAYTPANAEVFTVELEIYQL